MGLRVCACVRTCVCMCVCACVCVYVCACMCAWVARGKRGGKKEKIRAHSRMRVSIIRECAFLRVMFVRERCLRVSVCVCTRECMCTCVCVWACV